MTTHNIYKPRYKIAFKSNSKVWPYKNSRLRRFFNIRGRKLVRRGLFKRYFLVFNNMKWTIARRYIRPYMKKRRPLKRRYRQMFYTKQQLRAFYGKQKEEAFRNFFKRYLKGAKGRNNTFAAALERRVDVFLFRLRLLPTIYASHQYVHHFGLIVNNRKETSPYALVKPGDIVSFDKKVWAPFVEYVFERLYWRVYGRNIWKRRQFKSLRKKIWWLSKKQFFKKSNTKLLNKFNFSINKLLKIHKRFSTYIPQLYCNIEYVENKVNFQDKMKGIILLKMKEDLLFFWNNYKINLTVLIKKLIKLSKKQWRLKIWSWRHYYTRYFSMISSIFRLYKLLKYYLTKFQTIELNFSKVFVELDLKNNIDKDLLYLITLQKNVTNQIKNFDNNLFFYKSKLLICMKKKQLLIKAINTLKYKYNYLIWNNINLIKSKNHNNILITNNLKSIKFKVLFRKMKKLQFIKNDISKIIFKIKALTEQKDSSTVALEEKIATLNTNFKMQNQNKLEANRKITLQMNLLEKELSLFKNKLGLLLNFVLKQRIKRFNPKRRWIKDVQTSEKKLRKTSLLYFFFRRRLKKKRKRAITRLKKIHWYVPAYIYFDLRTLRAVFLYNPKPEEIMYSFKCSLRGIHSFYRSLGV